MKSQKITFINKEGNQLSARMNLPVDETPIAYAIFAHCFTCGKDLLAAKNISRSLTANGIAVLLFDFTGLGESEGAFESSTFTSNVNDLQAASDFLSAKYEAPKIIIGHSLGGTAAIFAAGYMDHIKAVAAIAAPFEPLHLTKLIKDDLDKIEKEGKAKVDIGGRPFTINKSFLEDLATKKAEEVVKKLRKPLLILHSPQDTIVGIENAAKIYMAAMHPKSFISLNGADHLLSRKNDSLYAGDMIASWAKNYLDIENKYPSIPAKENPHQVIALTANNSYTTEIKSGRHRLLADEPLAVGGEDRGPSPYDLLSSALAACTSMTLQMYARRKKWNLEEVKVYVNHFKDYAQDCENCEQANTKIDHFHREILITGAIEEDQRLRLLEIADKCPVHKTLHATIKIKTQLTLS